MTAADRFWTHVQRTATCWYWMAGCIGGYGQFRLDEGHTARAHRLAWELTCGPIPPGMWVRHRCHVKRCVNPEHLHLTDAHEKDWA